MSGCFSASPAPENGPNPEFEADNAASATSLTAPDPRASLPQTEPGTVTLPEDPDPAGHELPAAPSGDGRPAPGGMDAGADEGITPESPSASEGPAPSTDAADLPDNRAVANDTTEAKAPQRSEHSPIADSPADCSITAESAADDEQFVPRLSKQAMESLLDEATGELVALEDLDGEVDVEAYRRYWFGTHSAASLAACQIEYGQRGKCTSHVDESYKLLDDPDEFLLAKRSGVPITLCIHRGLTEDQKLEFILRPQNRKRVCTEKEQRRLRNEWIEVRLRLGEDYDTIAKMAAVCQNTVRNVENRAAANRNSKLENTKRDRRTGNWTPEDIEKARRLHAAGKKQWELASLFDTSPTTVSRWLKPGKKPTSGQGIPPAKPTEDTASNHGISEFHRRVIEHVGRDVTAYDESRNKAAETARQVCEAVSTNANKLLDLNLYGSQLAAASQAQLEKLLSTSGEVDAEEASPADSSPESGEYEVDTELDVKVVEVSPDGVFVALPNGKFGVLDERDMGRVLNAQPKEGERARARVKGVDEERKCLAMKLLGRQSSSDDETVGDHRPDFDHRSNPYAEVAGLKAGPTEREVV